VSLAQLVLLLLLLLLLLHCRHLVGINSTLAGCSSDSVVCMSLTAVLLVSLLLSQVALEETNSCTAFVTRVTPVTLITLVTLVHAQVALEENSDAVTLANLMPKHWADFIRNSPMDEVKPIGTTPLRI
jgi:hypothetical protein